MEFWKKVEISKKIKNLLSRQQHFVSAFREPRKNRAQLFFFVFATNLKL